MKLPSLPKNFPTVMLVSLLVNGALLGQEPTWIDDGSVVRLEDITDKVGIGTNLPGYKLDVIGTGRFSSTLTSSVSSGNLLYSSNGGVQTFLLTNDDILGVNLLRINDAGVGEGIDWQSGRNISIYTTGQGGHNAFQFNTTSSYPFVFDGGNVGIGTSSPAAILDVEGGTSDTSPTGTPIARFLRGTGGSNFIAIFGDNNGNYIVADDPGTNQKNLRLQTKNGKHILLEPVGSVGIGTSSIPSGYKLAVDGKIIVEEVKVKDSGSWLDHIFKADYRLRPLAEVERYIQTHKHLPDIPSATEFEENGVSLGDMQARLLQKVEELTLYVIELDKENQALKERVAELER